MIMSRSEFRFNKKRKHYAYLFKDTKSKTKNILITSKPVIIRFKKGRQIIKNNIPLFRHPNPNKSGQFYLIARVYVDEIYSFDEHKYKSWVFDKNDKRKVKRLKKQK